MVEPEKTVIYENNPKLLEANSELESKLKIALEEEASVKR